MDIALKSEKKFHRWAKLLVAAILVGLIIAVCIRVMIRADAIGERQRTRAAFIDAVSRAKTFDQLRNIGLLLPRDDGGWIVIKSDAGYQWGNWTLAADSEGKWSETTDGAYELFWGVHYFPYLTKQIEDCQKALRDADLDADTRQMWQERLSGFQESQQKLYPFQAQHAPTLAAARAILKTRGFADVPDLPRPYLAGVTTRPATTTPAAPTPAATSATSSAPADRH